MSREEVLDKRKLEELREIVGGQEYLVELIDAFLDEAPRLLADLQRGFDQKDAATLTRAAHSLKSNSADFGAVEFNGLCKDLESKGRAGSLEQAAALIARAEEEFEKVKTALERIRA